MYYFDQKSIIFRTNVIFGIVILYLRLALKIMTSLCAVLRNKETENPTFYSFAHHLVHQ